MVKMYILTLGEMGIESLHSHLNCNDLLHLSDSKKSIHHLSMKQTSSMKKDNRARRDEVNNVSLHTIFSK